MLFRSASSIFSLMLMEDSSSGTALAFPLGPSFPLGPFGIFSSCSVFFPCWRNCVSPLLVPVDVRLDQSGILILSGLLSRHFSKKSTRRALRPTSPHSPYPSHSPIQLFLRPHNMIPAIHTLYAAKREKYGFHPFSLATTRCNPQYAQIRFRSTLTFFISRTTAERLTPDDNDHHARNATGPEGRKGRKTPCVEKKQK